MSSPPKYQPTEHPGYQEDAPQYQEQVPQYQQQGPQFQQQGPQYQQQGPQYQQQGPKFQQQGPQYQQPPQTAVPPPNVHTPLVTTQPYGVQYNISTEKPNDYMGLSIFSCLCCCWIFGLIAIMYSSEVSDSWGRGDYLGARIASRKARSYNIAAITFGLVSAVLSGISVGVRFAIYANTSDYPD